MKQKINKIEQVINYSFKGPAIKYLSGQMLVATSLLDGSCFEKAVVYLCAHNDGGAMGILVNHTLNKVKSDDILHQMGLNSNKVNFDGLPIYFGGPVESSRGFILHTSDYANDGTQRLYDNISLTSTVNILQDMALGIGPYKKIVALGCAGWAPGQIEKEIRENAWLTLPADETIIFDTDNDNKWQRAMGSLGVNSVNFSKIAGNA